MVIKAASGSTTVLPDNLLSLDDFNDTGLLQCLKSRYQQNDIYTWVGSVLVSINPYQDIGVFADVVAAKYAKTIPAQGSLAAAHQSSPPHIFAAVAGALASPGQRHALLISGESGAGKTEATRASLAFLAKHCNASDVVRDRLLDSNPVLEAFGNAKTRQNGNSSRFGKFIEVHISAEGKLLGATLRPYMLEASRVSGRLHSAEQTYHVFYHVRAALAALSNSAACSRPFWQWLRQLPEWQELAQVGSPALLASSRLAVGPKAEECLESFERLYGRLLGAGMTHADIVQCARVVAAVGVLADEEAAGEALASKLQELLGVPQDQMLDFFTNVELTVGTIGRERLIRCRSGSEMRTLQASLAQELYSSLFVWVSHLVARGVAPAADAVAGKRVGLLDLYGFEVFDSNGFEQFLINYCNERIQQLFNRQVFLNEASEYLSEGLDDDGRWQHLASACNLPALSLLEGGTGVGCGIFGVINDRSRCGFDAALSGDGSEIVDSIASVCGGHSSFRRSTRDAGRVFGVSHFAGDVYYETRNFVLKNASSHRPDIVAFFRSHANGFVRQLFEVNIEGGCGLQECGGSNGPEVLCMDGAETPKTANGPIPRRRLVGSTLISAFRMELNELCTTLEMRECRHIRCLRPNDCQQPLFVDDASMFRQCRYSGLLEATRIRRYGFPHRRSLASFAQRYATILTAVRRAAHTLGCEPPPRLQEVMGVEAAKAACISICNTMHSIGIDSKEACIGHTKIFLKESALEWLESARIHFASASIVASSASFLARRRFTKVRRMVQQLQFRLRRAQARAKAKSAAVTLQRWWHYRILAQRRLQPPEAAQMESERWKAQRCAGWDNTVACDSVPCIASSPLSTCLPQGSPFAIKKQTPRAGTVSVSAVPAAGARQRARHTDKENNVPRCSKNIAVNVTMPRKTDSTSHSTRNICTTSMRQRTASPVSPSQRSSRRGLHVSPDRLTDRLQAQLVWVGRALREREIPEEKAEMLEGFLNSLMPPPTSLSAAARGSRTPAMAGRQRGAGGITLQPPWRPVSTKFFGTESARSSGLYSRNQSSSYVGVGAPRIASVPRRSVHHAVPAAASHQACSTSMHDSLHDRRPGQGCSSARTLVPGHNPSTDKIRTGGISPPRAPPTPRQATGVGQAGVRQSFLHRP